MAYRPTLSKSQPPSHKAHPHPAAVHHKQNPYTAPSHASTNESQLKQLSALVVNLTQTTHRLSTQQMVLESRLQTLTASLKDRTGELEDTQVKCLDSLNHHSELLDTLFAQVTPAQKPIEKLELVPSPVSKEDLQGHLTAIQKHQDKKLKKLKQFWH